uniref:EF-hand domain-containing protein n=1 Tax=Haptolina brevifila TaxID=156173 RepID=A0A7S2I7X8_9EUKA
MDDIFSAATQAATDLFNSAVSNLDQNADGSLDMNDLPPLLRYQLLQRLDSNGDGTVDASDLAPLLVNKLDPNGTGHIDLHNILSDKQIETLSTHHITQYGDLKSDGIIDSRDLPVILSHAGTISFNSLSDNIRNSLMYALDRNSDGSISTADLNMILDASGLRSSAVGTHLLSSLGDGHGNYSPQQLFIVLNELERLRTASSVSTVDGMADLSSLSPALRQALLDDLDMDNDGQLTFRDLDPLLAPLTSSQDDTTRALISTLDRDRDGVITVADLPPSLKHRGSAWMEALDTDDSGSITIDELSTGVLKALGNEYSQSLALCGRTSCLGPPSPPVPPRPPVPYVQSSGGDGGVLTAFLGIFLVALACGVGWMFWRFVVHRKRNIESKHLVGPEMPSSTAASYVPSQYIPAQYNAPMPPVVGEVTSSTVRPTGEQNLTLQGQTRNTGALDRARAANATDPPSSSRV